MKDSNREAFESYEKNAVIVKLVDFSGDHYVAKNSGTWHEIARSQSAADKLNDNFSLWKAAKASAVPDGFVLVPKEPTDEIRAAMDGWDLYDYELINDCYKAMIKAAQEQGHESE